MNRIKSIRVLKGIKQKDMAKSLGITPQYLSRIESGKVDLKLSALKRIADILNVSINELVK